jgi:sec-independent protein translocase protein TatA
MFGLGTTELIIILVLVMIIFGAGKLPQVGGALGKGLRNFKDGVKEGNEEKSEEEPEKIDEKDQLQIRSRFFGLDQLSINRLRLAGEQS